MEIKVLGPGCANCRRLESVARGAILEMGMEATLVKVTEWDQIMAYDIMSTPGLVINDKVVCAGRVPSKAEVVSLIATALDQSDD